MGSCGEADYLKVGGIIITHILWADFGQEALRLNNVLQANELCFIL